MIYLDNASTTRMLDESIKIESEINNNLFYNASALYLEGTCLKNKLNNAHNTILNLIGANVNFDKLIFTGSATESNNSIINSFITNKNDELIISAGEHPSIYNKAKQLQSIGYIVHIVKLNKDGIVDINDFKSKLSPKTKLISIIHVSNETGAINNIKELVGIAKDYNPKIIFHSDCVQSFCKININVTNLGVDAITISSHKIHGPKGVGALFIKNGVNFKPFLIGGGQENNLRSGTENVAGILAFENSAKIMHNKLLENYNSVVTIKNELINNLNNAKINYSLNSSSVIETSPYIVSLSIPKLRAETILHLLNDSGILIGNGSACSSKNTNNRVLEAMGISKELISGNIRVSFSNLTTVSEINEFVKILKKVIDDLKIKVLKG